MVTSLDILYLVIAFAILWVAAFVCWFIYQIVMITKEMHRTIHTLTFAIENVEKAINGIKGKFGTGKISDHVRTAVESLREKIR